MNNQLHVVLGASGVIGKSVVAELRRRNLPTRLVERSAKIADKDFFQANLLSEAEATLAISGASHVYMCVGLPYSASVWEREWPVVMKNIITASGKTGAVIVFLDNIYMYGPEKLQSPITEAHPQVPRSRKGKVRKEIADMLIAAHREGKVKMVIGRSADFYGPGARTSLLYVTVVERMLAGKDPQWLASPEFLHSFAYTEDNGRALVTLALDESSYGEVWHLPVAAPTQSITQIVETINTLLGTTHKIAVLPKFMLGILSLFISGLREVKEMLYQTEHDYVFSDAKFRNTYPDFAVTSLQDGLSSMVQFFKKS